MLPNQDIDLIGMYLRPIFLHSLPTQKYLLFLKTGNYVGLFQGCMAPYGSFLRTTPDPNMLNYWLNLTP